MYKINATRNNTSCTIKMYLKGAKKHGIKR